MSWERDPLWAKAKLYFERGALVLLPSKPSVPRLKLVQ